MAALVLLAGCGGTPAGTATTGDTAAQSTTEPTPTGATPTTGEQILHGSSPVSEPLRELTVRTEVSEHWTVDDDRGWRLGEPVLRYVLETGLSEERAADAAGWGNDYVAVFERGDESGYAWVIRWDSVDAAAEFESAFGHYERTGSEPLSLVTVDRQTTVILSGERSFVENATVRGTSENVTVVA